MVPDDLYDSEEGGFDDVTMSRCVRVCVCERERGVCVCVCVCECVCVFGV